LAQDLQIKLLSWLRDARKIVVIGVGNELRGDDSVGVRVARNLKAVLDSSKVSIIETGTVPENYLGTIERLNPSHVLVIDAADTGLEPGSVVLSELSEAHGLTVSTHHLPLSVFAEYLKRVTGAKTALLAIQPGNVEFKTSLTVRVREAAVEVEKIFLDVLSGNFSA
jgi:hydrogenase 3 maturation protease